MPSFTAARLMYVSIVLSFTPSSPAISRSILPASRPRHTSFSRADSTTRAREPRLELVAQRVDAG